MTPILSASLRKQRARFCLGFLVTTGQLWLYCTLSSNPGSSIHLQSGNSVSCGSSCFQGKMRSEWTKAMPGKLLCGREEIHITSACRYHWNSHTSPAWGQWGKELVCSQGIMVLQDGRGDKDQQMVWILFHAWVSKTWTMENSGVPTMCQAVRNVEGTWNQLITMEGRHF
jgi:hypothetical protein